MKIFKLLACVLFIQTQIFAFQNDSDSHNYSPKSDGKPSIHYGPTSINDQNMENLTVYGPSTLEQTGVSHMAILKGPVDAKRSSFKRVHIDGIANFTDVKVSKELIINGPLYARNSILKEVSIASNEAILSNSKIKKMIVRENNRSAPTIIYLEKGSQIGSINFHQKNGKVVLRDESSSVKNIEGGEIVKR